MRNNLRLIRRALNGNEAAADELGEEIDIGESLCCEIERLREDVGDTNEQLQKSMLAHDYQIGEIRRLEEKLKQNAVENERLRRLIGDAAAECQHEWIPRSDYGFDICRKCHTTRQIKAAEAAGEE